MLQPLFSLTRYFPNAVGAHFGVDCGHSLALVGVCEQRALIEGGDDVEWWSVTCLQ
jgi:hypothetical protein